MRIIPKFFSACLLGILVIGRGLVWAATPTPTPTPAPSHVEVKKDTFGQWQLLVDGQPFFVKGVVYGFTVVGDDPNVSTMRDWSVLDVNKNGKNDVAYESWADKNNNNRRDKAEPRVGDWQLLKDLGCNTIRVYQMPTTDPRLKDLYLDKGSQLTFWHNANKEIFRDLYKRYGIRVAVGHFFGEWTIGTAAKWEEGVNYNDPVQRQRLLDCVRVMVEEHKDEPYTLMWILGNENFMPYDHDNAEKDPKAFLTLVNEAAQLIHQLDPHHPVALCNWEAANLGDIARYAPDVDIFGMNSYRRDFSELYQEIKKTFDRPVLLTEFGTQVRDRDALDRNIEKNYFQVSWRSIWQNRLIGKGAGNSIGGMVFAWSDQWYLAGKPDEQNQGFFMGNADMGMPAVEWFGITGQGNGKNSPFERQLKQIYFVIQSLWSR